MTLRLPCWIALLFCTLAPCPAQEPPFPETYPPTLTANERFVYVLRDGVLYQFDARSLSFLRMTRIPAPEGQPTARPEEGSRPKAIDPIEEELATAGPGGGAGVRYRGRAGREGLSPRGKKTATAIEAALDWLSAHQDEDGKWDADGFMKHDGDGELSDGKGSPVHDVGVTGLALLTFLGDGSTMKAGPYSDNVRRGVKWLASQQQDNGLFGTNSSHDFIYGHAIATYAMVEAYGLSDLDSLKMHAQKGLDYLESHRNPYSVWRYQPRGNDNDTSVTTWCVMAYESAKFFDLKVSENALKLAATWFDSVTDPTGRCGYTKIGEPSSRHPGDHATRFPVDKGEALTAAALFCRFFMGQDPEHVPVLSVAADLLVSKPPVWDVKAGTIDHYYWYFATYALYQMGGRHWKEWSSKLTPTVTENQRQYGNFKGSWDPAGPWGNDGGRVYSTALMTLTLESYFRYASLVR